jgi:hypothetical protein
MECAHTLPRGILLPAIPLRWPPPEPDQIGASARFGTLRSVNILPPAWGCERLVAGYFALDKEPPRSTVSEHLLNMGWLRWSRAVP